ncbi:MAG: hypothetical protein Q7J73_06895 [Dehalococcoidales bacterium]|nr:hypothetical protein [Dehalococcoidales bacterium]
MSRNWQKAYDELKDYINKNPGIEIGANIICIPSDVRPEFYRLFGRVSLGFIKDNLPGILEKGYVLSKRWNEVSQAAVDSLKLESIDMDADTRWFLLDPNDGLTRILFDPLFDVLKGKKDLTAFEQTAASTLQDGFSKYLREGYQSWTVMSLLKLLSTDKVYYVEPADIDADASSHVETAAVEGLEESVPDATETNKISFKHSLKYSFLVPNIIGHSASLNLFAAFVPDFDYSESKWRARRVNADRKWYEISDIKREFGRGKLWPDLAIYIGEHWKDLVVAADYSRMAQPDIIVEFRIDKDWYEKEGLETVKRHNNILKPKLGSFVVCIEPVSEAALKELEEKPALQPVAAGTAPEAMVGPVAQPVPMGAANEAVIEPPLNIHLLSVEYDVTKLEPIIEAIIKAQTKPEEAAIENTPSD